MLLHLDACPDSSIDYLQQQRTPSMTASTQITVTQRPIGQDAIGTGTVVRMQDTCGKAKRHAEANTEPQVETRMAGDSKE